MKILVTYASKYGSTQQYAQWLAEELGAELCESKAVTPAQLAPYDVVIHGGGLYAGSISGIKLLRDNAAALAGKRVAVFTVGTSDPADTASVDYIRSQGAKQLAQGQSVSWFHLRGDLLYGKMSWLHRMMMGMMGKVLAKKPEAERAEGEKAIINHTDVRFVDRATLAPLVAWVRGN